MRIVGWYNDDSRVLNGKLAFNDGRTTNVIGNPLIACYTKYNVKIADGYMVRIEDGYLIVDQFGKDYIYVKNGGGNYCILGESK